MENNPQSKNAPCVDNKTIQGRSIFIIETTHDGVTVQTGFFTNEGEILRMPAIFQNKEYALEQIESLRVAVIKHFSNLKDISLMSNNINNGNITIQ